MASMYDLLRDVAAILEKLKIEYYVTGSVASVEFGTPRTTADIDIVIQLRPEKVDALAAALDPERFFFDAQSMRDAVKHRSMFNIIDKQSIFKIDFIIPSTSYGAHCFSRAVRRTTVNNVTAMFASPEDVILNKLLFFHLSKSEKHLIDIGEMLRVSGDELDWKYLDEWADYLDVLREWYAIKQRTGR
ncbi:MAG: nucleotidyltransferase family protein [Phycisphaerales bacterium]